MRSAVQLGLFCGLIAIDQYTKTHLASTYTLNQGVSFGIGAALPPLVLGGLLGVILLLGVKVVSISLVQTWSRYAYLVILFLAGACSNLLDRVWWGGVKDWLPIPLTGLYNNLADWYITIAVVWYLVRVILEKNKTAEIRTT